MGASALPRGSRPAGRPDARSARRRPRRGLVLGVIGAGAALALAGCGTSSSSSPPGGGSSSGRLSGRLVVFAAASLSDAFDKIGGQFESAHPGVTVKFNYAGSSSLATQLTHGAPADVFASANPRNMKVVTDENLASGSPEVFARNRLEIMVGSGNPKKIKTVGDLANPDVKVVVCAPDVPCGAYSEEVFKKAGVTVKPVSEETSVSGVVTKVSLGEADAGIVYVTDVKAGGDKVEGVTIPSDQNVVAQYPIVQVKDSPNASAAKAFISYVLGPEGQKVLASFGFMSPGS